MKLIKYSTVKITFLTICLSLLLFTIVLVRNDRHNPTTNTIAVYKNYDVIYNWCENRCDTIPSDSTINFKKHYPCYINTTHIKSIKVTKNLSSYNLNPYDIDTTSIDYN